MPIVMFTFSQRLLVKIATGMFDLENLDEGHGLQFLQWQMSKSTYAIFTLFIFR